MWRAEQAGIFSGLRSGIAWMPMADLTPQAFYFSDEEIDELQAAIDARRAAGGGRLEGAEAPPLPMRKRGQRKRPYPRALRRGVYKEGRL